MKKLVNGQLVDFTEQEIQELNTWNQGRFDRLMMSLRAKRDALLNETDWIVTKAKETGTTIPTAWKTYRQALRDITEGLTTVEEVEAVVFPEKP
jgi:hypothetical protein